MVTMRQQQRMLDYLVSKLEPNYAVEPAITERIPGINTRYIKVGPPRDEPGKYTKDNYGIVLLVDQKYPRERMGRKFRDTSLRRIYDAASRQFLMVLPVLYKDGKTFFRSAAEKHYYKKSKGLSLKNYTDEEIHRMIMLSPEEIFLKGTTKGVLQYYQPESRELSECIATYSFMPVIADYTGRPAKNGFQPPNRELERDHISLLETDSDKPMILSPGLLMH